MTHKERFTAVITSQREHVLADVQDGFTVDEILDNIIEKAPDNPKCQRHAKWIQDHRKEAGQIIAGILGLC